MSRFLVLMLLFSFGLQSYSPNLFAAVRIKDIADVQGVRENILIGYGLVVGLKGTGDSASSFTSRSLARMLDKFGVPLQGQEVTSQNVAAVMVTTYLPAYARKGSRVDVQVSSIGDASSLEGGTLVSTPLLAGDQKVYAVSQGLVSTGGLKSEGVSTLGRILSGGFIEREITQESFYNKKGLRLALKQADFTTAARIAKSINMELGGKFALAKDPRTVDLIVPFGFEGNTVELMALVESVSIEVDGKAKVVINERTGTLVAGEKVRIQKVALSHGDLMVEIEEEKPKDEEEEPQRALAGGGGGGDEEAKKLASVHVMGGHGDVGDLAKVLNTLGVKPKDLIAIFQALKAAGALQADIEII